MVQSTVMDAVAVHRSLSRMASEILERCGAPENFALVGIWAGGHYVCKRLAELIEQLEGRRPETGSLDITLYRDDLYTGLEKPVLGETRLPFKVTGTRIVLVDDVLFTGRTVRAAMDEIWDYGRPEWIRLAVLVDRGHRELPFAADFVGRRLETRMADKVHVRMGVGEGQVAGVTLARHGEVA
jgi:pyrimidine operon attenuation protein/uracil phosphoribosyltransferase